MKYPLPGIDPRTPIFFRYLYPFSAVSLEISSSKLSSLMEGIRSFFLILPVSIAFRIELVSCRYLGVAANSSTVIQLNTSERFIYKDTHPSLHISRRRRPRNNRKERTG